MNVRLLNSSIPSERATYNKQALEGQDLIPWIITPMWCQKDEILEDASVLTYGALRERPSTFSKVKVS